MEKLEAQNDQNLKDMYLKNQTQYDKDSGELQNETKKINFDRNAKFTDHVQKTNHVVRQETLERKNAYDKLETDTNYKSYAEELERTTAYEQKKTESNRI